MKNINNLFIYLILGLFLVGLVSATTITVSHNADLTGEQANGITVKRGMNITLINSVNITQLSKYPSTNATMCYLYDADSNLMTNASFIGNSCNLTGNITTIAGQQYQILMDRLGASYTINGSLSVLPINSEGLTWNQGCFNSCGSQNGQVFGFTNLTYTVLNTGTFNTNQVISLCNATYTNKFLNITFRDEGNLSILSASIPSSTFTYWLSIPSMNKTFTFSNSSQNLNYNFCTSINDGSSQTIIPEIAYASTNYPQRNYQPGLITFTNITNNHILYLLSSNEGIYVTFVTSSLANTVIPGASIVISRLISGVDTIVANGVTDSAGSFTAWLNPTFPHTIFADKTGYGSTTQTITPTQSSYTILLGSTTNFTYVSNVKGLLWAYFPRNQLSNVSTNFGFNVSSVYGNIVKCRIDLLNNFKNVTLSTNETIVTNGSFCSVQTAYTPNQAYPQIKGRLLVDLGSGYQILEEDAYWILIPYTTTGMTFTDWFNGLTKLDLSYFGGNEQHREYTYILVFFLVVMLICAVLNVAGWDIQTSGGMIFLVGGLVWIASVPGFLNLAGISPYAIIDKYFVAVVFSLFMIGFGTRNI